MNVPLPLPPLGPDAQRRDARRRLLLIAAGSLAFIAAAVAVPMALAGNGDDEPASRSSSPQTIRTEVAPAAPIRVVADRPDTVIQDAAPSGTRATEAETADGGADASRAQEAVPGTLVRRGKLEGAGTLSGLLKRHGLGASESHELAQALDGVFDVRRVRAADSYLLTVRPDGRKLVRLEYRVSPAEVYDVVRDRSGVLRARRRNIPIERVHLARGAFVSTSLFEAATSAGLRSGVVGSLAEILANEVDFYAHQRAGDSFRVIVDEERVAGQFQRYAPVQAISYEGEKAGRIRVYRFEDGRSGGASYFTSSGRSVEREFLRSPLKFVRVTSEFNPRRRHPILHRVMGHMGVDLGAPTGTPVYASAAGTIIARGDGGPAGNMVQIQHPDGLVTVYAHLSRFESGQSIGSRVQQRQVIGYVGATGRATGPHLHYAMKKNGRFIDPQNFEVRAARPVGRNRMDEFRRAITRLDRELDAIRLVR